MHMWIRKKADIEREAMNTEGHLKLDIEKALGLVSERKRNARGVRDRVLSDLKAVFNSSDVTFRELLECGFAIADNDEGVAMHIADIKLSEIFSTGDGPKTRRQITDKERVKKAVEEIFAVMRETRKPVTAKDVQESLPQFDIAHFRAAWTIAKRELKKSGNGPNTTWQMKKK